MTEEYENHRCPDCNSPNSVRVIEIIGPTFKLECEECHWWLQLQIDLVGGLHISTKDHPDGVTYWKQR